MGSEEEGCCLSWAGADDVVCCDVRGERDGEVTTQRREKIMVY